MCIHASWPPLLWRPILSKILPGIIHGPVPVVDASCLQRASAVRLEKLGKCLPQVLEVTNLVLAGGRLRGLDVVFDKVSYRPPELLCLFAVVVRVV